MGIDFAANQDSKSGKDKPMEKMVDDFGKCCDYDAKMILNPNILTLFLQSKYETEATEDQSENHLLFLYGCEWGIDFENIECPLFVYNGIDDTSCVPNMARFIFESVTKKKAQNMNDGNDIDLE